MDPPPVHYVTTSDGYDIAYTDSGQGLPFVFMPPTAASHVQLSRDLLTAGSWLKALTQRFRLIHYDSRGQGLSTRGLTPDFALDDFERDLKGVVDALGLDRFILFGTGYFGHVAIRFAAKYPQCVHALILLNTSISMKEWPMTMYRDLARENWELFIRNISPATTWDAEEREAAFNLFRQMVNQADHLIAADAFAASDVGELLSSLDVPTLVLAGRDFSHLSSAESTRLAARIPGAQLKLINGSALFANIAEGLPAIESFLSTLTAPAPPPAAPTSPAGTPLSQRELEVLRLISAGRSNPQIAEELVISLNTVQRHVSNILGKTGAANRTEAAGYARDRGLA